MELYPSSADALVYYGKGLAASGKSAAARAAFEQALGVIGDNNAAQKAAVEHELQAYRLGTVTRPGRCALRRYTTGVATPFGVRPVSQSAR